MVPPLGANASTIINSGLEPASSPMETSSFFGTMMFFTTDSCWLTLIG